MAKTKNYTIRQAAFCLGKVKWRHEEQKKTCASVSTNLTFQQCASAETHLCFLNELIQSISQLKSSTLA